jgi:hypothetical protein
LQEKATRNSNRHSGQQTRAKPDSNVDVVARPENGVIGEPFHFGTLGLDAILDLTIQLFDGPGLRQGFGRKPGHHHEGIHNSPRSSVSGHDAL